MAKTAALSLANSSWQSATVSAAPQQQLQPQLVNHTAGTSGYPNNNLDVAGPTSVSDEDMLQKMERMETADSVQSHGLTSEATTLAIRPHRHRPADEANDVTMNYDDDGNAKVLLPPTNSVTYPGVQSSSNKEPRRDATPSDKLESITIGTRSFSNSSVFGDLSQALWSGAEFSSTRPVELKRVVGKLASRFVGYDQHDAQEFLRFLLDGLHEDLNRILKKPAYYEIPDRPHAPERDLSDEYWQYYIQRNASALSEQFCGQLRSEVTCQTCSHRSICFDLPVPKKAKGGAIRFGAFKSTSSNDDTSMCTVHDCLRAYTEEEHMKDEDAFYCAKCKTHRSVVKSICLQRECRNPENGNWYDFNDETVSALKKPNAASASAYILFYQRKGQSAK
ncbi:hypothetical protein DYB35_001459 [Aphanomyces astaci]|uniref:ubiquitinyl hydrolase 1 n=1 Tax=Aphanomyces astaci TaxID=112090 RepID=A0A418CM80_APHAT|nr:hypothetical protein DYB35_001459 [Aphanomyces astaci]